MMHNKPSPQSPLQNNDIMDIVKRYFTIYENSEDEKYSAYYISIPEDIDHFNYNFDKLRDDLSSKGFIPLLSKKHGEYIIYVMPKPPMKKKSIAIPIILLGITLLTTILSGSFLFAEKLDINELTDPENLINGFLFFSFPLISILGIHETGHYLVSKKHKLTPSLPFFIPIPPNPIFPLGTMGAYISMREPIPNRKALLDIGAAGPICGFLVAIPVTIIGLTMSTLTPLTEIPSGSPMLGEPPLFLLLMRILLEIPPGSTVMLHPTAFAGWVGLLVTAINLLPAGQLDGGHIIRAILGDKQKYATWGTLAIMIGLGIFYPAWIFFAFLIIFILGSRHPPPLNDLDTLDTKRKWIALATLGIFVLSFTPIPIQ
jgi:membrane-associated protease RseP (regulator of RpoE activity)